MAVSVVLTAATLTGCAVINPDLRRSSQIQGELRARIELPDLPVDCRQDEPHAPLTEGAEIRSVLDREREALRREIARKHRCLDFYTYEVKDRYKSPGEIRIP